MGFHAPEEALRILGESINYTRLGQLSLRGTANPATPVRASHYTF
jgi:formate-dependent nitrite reductase cytochrome c552 subunit